MEKTLLEKVRSFYAKAMKKHGIYLTEECSADGSWSLRFGNTEPETIDAVFSAQIIGKNRSYPQSADQLYVRAPTQEDLWLDALLKMHIGEQEIWKIHEFVRHLNEDGIIELRWQIVFIFGCDISDCTSWEEIMLKSSVAGSDS